MLAFITKMLVLVLIYSYNIYNIFSTIYTYIHNYLIIIGPTWLIKTNY